MNDSVSEGVRADIADTVVSELVVIVFDDCKACTRSVVIARGLDGRVPVVFVVLNCSMRR